MTNMLNFVMFFTPPHTHTLTVNTNGLKMVLGLLFRNWEPKYPNTTTNTRGFRAYFKFSKGTATSVEYHVNY